MTHTSQLYKSKILGSPQLIIDSKSNFKIFTYNNHEEYVNKQIEKWKINIYGKWVSEIDIKFLYENFISKRFDKVNFGICHGAKTGHENKLFSKYTGGDFIGTDLSTSDVSENVIKWDFHDLKDEWINSVDIIYTNALDHTYKPVECLSNWIKCLSPNGVCIIEWTHRHGVAYGATWSDPLAANKEHYWEFIEKAGGKQIEELNCISSGYLCDGIKKYFLIFGK